MTRVAHLSGTSLPTVGGAEVFVHTLATEQVRRGHDVTVVSRWPIARLRDRLPYAVRPLVPTTFHQAVRGRLRPTGPWLLRAQLARLQRRHRFDLWHVHAAHVAGWASVGALRDLGVPVVLTAHGADLMVDEVIGYGHRLDPEVDERVRATVTRFHAVVAINRVIRETFTELGLPEARIHDIPNGVDIDRIAAHRLEPAEARRRCGLPADGPVVLTVARLDREVKGLDMLLDAADRIRDQVPGLTWLLVGPGVDGLAGELAERGLDDVVRLDPGEADRAAATAWPGEHLLAAYRAADLFVLPSRIEASPLVLFEAMAAGLPVVAADLAGCRDAVVHGVTGVLVPPGDGEALAAAVARLLQDPDLRSSQAAEALRHAPAHGIEAVADAYDRVYDEVGREVAA